MNASMLVKTINGLLSERSPEGPIPTGGSLGKRIRTAIRVALQTAYKEGEDIGRREANRALMQLQEENKNLHTQVLGLQNLLKATESQRDHALDRNSTLSNEFVALRNRLSGTEAQLYKTKLVCKLVARGDDMSMQAAHALADMALVGSGE